MRNLRKTNTSPAVDPRNGSMQDQPLAACEPWGIWILHPVSAVLAKRNGASLTARPRYPSHVSRNGRATRQLCRGLLRPMAFASSSKTPARPAPDPSSSTLNGTLQEVKDGLMAGQHVELHFAGTIPSGRYAATADAADQIVESREDNNTLTFFAPTPTPPLLCTPAPTSTP